jgi:hypothetical protein
VGDQFVKVSDGSPVAIHGINWFGFNNGMTWLNGLWAGGKSGNSDFATIVYELQLLVGANCCPRPHERAARMKNSLLLCQTPVPRGGG